MNSVPGDIELLLNSTTPGANFKLF